MDPISAKGLGGLSKLGGELGKIGAGRGGATPGKFEAIRASKLGGAKMDPVHAARNFLSAGKVDGPRPTTMAQRVAARDGIAFQPTMGSAEQQAGVWNAQRVGGTGKADTVANAIHDLNTGQERLEQIIQELRSGKEFSTQELLGLQAEVHLLSEQIQMSTKLVDAAMQSIKQVMQQQG